MRLSTYFDLGQSIPFNIFKFELLNVVKICVKFVFMEFVFFLPFKRNFESIDMISTQTSTFNSYKNNRRALFPFYPCFSYGFKLSSH